MAVDFDVLVHRSVVGALGETFTVTPRVGAAFDIQAVFSEPSLEVEIGGEVTVTGGAPTVSLRAADLPAGVVLGEGDVLTRQATGVVYRVAAKRADGEGWIDLQLHKV